MSAQFREMQQVHFEELLVMATVLGLVTQMRYLRQQVQTRQLAF